MASHDINLAGATMPAKLLHSLFERHNAAVMASVPQASCVPDNCQRQRNVATTNRLSVYGLFNSAQASAADSVARQFLLAFVGS